MTDFLSVKQLAEHLQVSDKTIYRMLWRGDLPGRRVGSQWRFSRSEVDFWLDLRLSRLAPPELREMSRAGAAGAWVPEARRRISRRSSSAEPEPR